jgi:hypothetical protein
MKNPFAVLGIEPEVLLLPDHQARVIVGDRGTALSRLFHPDANKDPGAEARFKEFQGASDELEGDVLWAEHKQHYLRATASTRAAASLDEERQVILRDTAELEDAFGDFLGNHARPGALPPFVEETPRRVLSTFRTPPCRLLFSRSGTTDRPGVRNPWGEFELEIAPDGSITHWEVDKEFYYPRDGVPTDTPSQFVFHRAGEMERKAPYWRRRPGSPGQPLPVRLIASLDRRRLPENASNRLSPGCLPGPDGLVGDDPTPGGYTWDQIKPCVRYFKPFLVPFYWVVATRMVDDRPRVWLLGLLQAFALTGPAP